MIETALAIVSLLIAIGMIVAGLYLLPGILALAVGLACLFAIYTPAGLAAVIGIALAWHVCMLAREIRHCWSPAPPSNPPPTAPARGAAA